MSCSSDALITSFQLKRRASSFFTQVLLLFLLPKPMPLLKTDKSQIYLSSCHFDRLHRMHWRLIYHQCFFSDAGFTVNRLFAISEKIKTKHSINIYMKHSSDATCLIYSLDNLSAKLRTAATIARVWPSLVPPIIAMSHTMITLTHHHDPWPYLYSTFLSYTCLPLRLFPIQIFWDLWTRPPKVIEGFRSYKNLTKYCILCYI